MTNNISYRPHISFSIMNFINALLSLICCCVSIFRVFQRVSGIQLNALCLQRASQSENQSTPHATFFSLTKTSINHIFLFTFSPSSKHSQYFPLSLILGARSSCSEEINVARFQLASNRFSKSTSSYEYVCEKQVCEQEFFSIFPVNM